MIQRTHNGRQHDDRWKRNPLADHDLQRRRYAPATATSSRRHGDSGCLLIVLRQFTIEPRFPSTDTGSTAPARPSRLPDRSSRPMKFCPNCGARSRRVPPGDSLPRDVCDACGSIHYQNPKLVVGSIPEWEGRHAAVPARDRAALRLLDAAGRLHGERRNRRRRRRRAKRWRKPARASNFGARSA